MKWIWSLLLCCLPGIALAQDVAYTGKPTASTPLPAASVTPCFTLTPGMDCAALVAKTIAAAGKTIEIESRGFTEPMIVDAIMAAKLRGVTVTLIVDKTAIDEQCERLEEVRRPAVGIPVFIDWTPRLADDRVLVIDDHLVITGSFNLTQASERDNAGNLVIIDSAPVAAAYDTNFKNRLGVSEPWTGSHKDMPTKCVAR